MTQEVPQNQTSIKSSAHLEFATKAFESILDDRKKTGELVSMHLIKW